MQVRELMTKTVKLIDETATLQEAAEMMRDNDIGILPVAEAGRPIGMVTDRDIVVRALAENKDPAETRVREIITPRLCTVYEDIDVTQAAELMAREQVRRLLVLDHDQLPVGIVSLGDLATAQADGSSAPATADAALALKGVSQPERSPSTFKSSHP